MNEKISEFIKSQGWEDFAVVGGDEVKKALDEHENVFEDWVGKGFDADMNYLRDMQQDRFHPEGRFPGLKSVIVLGAWYGYEQKMCSTKEGVVARYAAGRDYHKVLKKKLNELGNFLRSLNPLAETYGSVDSGPLVDRVLANTAGLGFFGKNSMIINPKKGSYFFIASLLTNLDLTVTEKRQMPNCGDCKKCFNACPTGAIKGPGQIDANLCISYLTIENKGSIPVELRKKMGNRLFGCDICQEVCPFNIGRASHQVVKIEKLAQGGVGESLDLAELLAIKSDDEFLKRFAGTPLMRAKRRGLLRNACVVAGNSGDRNLIPALERVLSEEDEMLQEHAKWAIDQLNNG